MENKEREEIIKGIFVGDTVILEKETKESKKNGFKIGDVGIVSVSDNEKSLKGWKRLDYEKTLEKTINKLNSKEIDDLFLKIVDILGESEVSELLKKINK